MPGFVNGVTAVGFGMLIREMGLEMWRERERGWLLYRPGARLSEMMCPMEYVSRRNQYHTAVSENI